MKTRFTSLCLFAASALFVAPDYLKAYEAAPLFQSYLAACKNTKNQAVHLRNTSQEKASSFTEMTILNLVPLSMMQIEAVAERILYADVDIVHLPNTSTQKAFCLYEMLQDVYSHFIHIPNKEQGLFIASKYPLSRAVVTFIEEENSFNKKSLEFIIHGANTYSASVSSNAVSMQITDLDDHKDSVTTPILLIDVPGTLTVIKQTFSPLRLAKKVDLLAAETFQLIPVKHKGGGNDDKGGYKSELDLGYSWGGKDGGHWEGTVGFEAHDNHGNYVEAEVKQDDKGEGSANARAGHEEK